jgi:hypothetical protein
MSRQNPNGAPKVILTESLCACVAHGLSKWPIVFAAPFWSLRRRSQAASDHRLVALDSDPPIPTPVRAPLVKRGFRAPRRRSPPRPPFSAIQTHFAPLPNPHSRNPRWRVRFQRNATPPPLAPPGFRQLLSRSRCIRGFRTASTNVFGCYAGRWSPHFFIRVTNVVGFTPRSSAAPSAPLIFQFVLCRAARRFSRSRRCSSGSVRISGWLPVASRVERRGGECLPGRSKSSAPPRETMTARSITFRSSRMLPGQS